MHFDFALFLSTIPTLCAAAIVNVRLAIIIVILSLVLGTLLTIVRTFKIWIVNTVVSVLISFVRGTPILIQVFIAYYVLPLVGLDLSPAAAGVIAMTFNNMMFISEIMRATLSTIDSGQVEAAVALGMRPTSIWLRILVPQLFQRSLPLLVNEATIVLKSTTILALITVTEMFRTAQVIGNAAFSPFETLLAAAIVFMTLNLTVSAAGKLMERRMMVARI